ncbi:hypothetical protein P7C73_g4016, partial [Tremellales sp. Uapishka_1]
MQVVPPAAIIIETPSPLIPGPFILLFLLPIIPLLLFSIGARPPDGTNLPFSTDDIFQMTAFITVAGAVVLCVGVYPGAFGSVATWIKQGGTGGSLSVKEWWWRQKAAEPSPALEGRRQRAISPPPPMLGYMPSRQRHALPAKVRYHTPGVRYTQPEYGWRKVDDDYEDEDEDDDGDEDDFLVEYADHQPRQLRPGSPHRGARFKAYAEHIGGRRANWWDWPMGARAMPQRRRTVRKTRLVPKPKPRPRRPLRPPAPREPRIEVVHAPPEIVLQEPVVFEPPLPLLELRDFPDYASKQLAYIREGFLNRFYSDRPPDQGSFLLGGGLLIVILVLGLGHLIGAGYDQDAASSSASRSSSGSGPELPSWVKRELRKRADETPEQTAKRVADEKKAEEQKDKEKAKKESKEETEKRRKAERRKREGEEKVLAKELEKAGKRTGSEGEKAKDKEKEKKKEGEGAEKETGGKKDENGDEAGGKMDDKKRPGLGTRLRKAVSGKKSSGEPATAALPETPPIPQTKVNSGPAWHAADQAVAHAAIAQSTSNAQVLADRMTAEKRAGGG